MATDSRAVGYSIVIIKAPRRICAIATCLPIGITLVSKVAPCFQCPFLFAIVTHSLLQKWLLQMGWRRITGTSLLLLATWLCGQTSLTQRHTLKKYSIYLCGYFNSTVCRFNCTNIKHMEVNTSYRQVPRWVTDTVETTNCSQFYKILTEPVL